MKVLITGASSGMGRDMAKILSQKYEEMVLVARNKERLEILKKELKNSFAKIKIIAMDLSVPENCIKLYNDNKEVDLLINNAGFGDTGRFYETNLEKDILMINTNVTACHILTKLYLQDMKKRDKGQILNVASIAGFFPGPLMATYYSTKAYVVRLSESIREELRKERSNVKISILCPGPVKTNFEKTANINYKFSGKNSFEVAKYALEHLKRFYIVPGVETKFTRIISKFIPDFLMAKIIYKVKSTKR